MSHSGHDSNMGLIQVTCANLPRLWESHQLNPPTLTLIRRHSVVCSRRQCSIMCSSAIRPIYIYIFNICSRIQQVLFCPHAKRKLTANAIGKWAQPSSADGFRCFGCPSHQTLQQLHCWGLLLNCGMFAGNKDLFHEAGTGNLEASTLRWCTLMYMCFLGPGWLMWDNVDTCTMSFIDALGLFSGTHKQ